MAAEVKCFDKYERHMFYTVDQHEFFFFFFASSDSPVMELYLEVSQYGTKAS